MLRYHGVNLLDPNCQNLLTTGFGPDECDAACFPALHGFLELRYALYLGRCQVPLAVKESATNVYVAARTACAQNDDEVYCSKLFREVGTPWENCGQMQRLGCCYMEFRAYYTSTLGEENDERLRIHEHNQQCGAATSYCNGVSYAANSALSLAPSVLLLAITCWIFR